MSIIYLRLIFELVLEAHDTRYENMNQRQLGIDIG
jgi:hypothetical protein